MPVKKRQQLQAKNDPVFVQRFTPNLDRTTVLGVNKKLSYRKQIVRQLRTQYVDGIYSKHVTLKYGLEDTDLE